MKKEALTPEMIEKLKNLDEMALMRGQTLAEMALAWLLQNEYVTSVIVGASSVEQLADNLSALDSPAFDEAELQRIDEIVKG